MTEGPLPMYGPTEPQKIRVLLVWGHHRRTWVAPFEQLQGRLEFTFLSRIVRPSPGSAPHPDDAVLTHLPVAYWGDFRSADEILDKLKPDRIVFMGLASGRSIALNVAAQRRRIRTFVLQHGFELPWEALREEIARSTYKTSLSERLSARNGSAALPFVLRSFMNGSAGDLLRFVSFMGLQRIRDPFVAVRRADGRFRHPDRYICLSRANTELFRELYGANDEEMDIIGIPEFDPFFWPQSQSIPCRSPSQPYDLLIDWPVASNQFQFTWASREETIAFYVRLSASAKADGVRLKVKLHPLSYADDWFPADANIDWIRDADLPYLLKNCRHCFSHSSTLMFPAIFYRPVCMLSLSENPVIRELADKGLALRADFHEFKPEEVNFGAISRERESFLWFVRTYLHRVDGRSTERLGQILLAGGEPHNAATSDSVSELDSLVDPVRTEQAKPCAEFRIARAPGAT